MPESKPVVYGDTSYLLTFLLLTVLEALSTYCLHTVCATTVLGLQCTH